MHKPRCYLWAGRLRAFEVMLDEQFLAGEELVALIQAKLAGVVIDG